MTPTPFLTLPDGRGYGTLKINVDGKPHEVIVTNHLQDPDEICNFRVIHKTKDGLIRTTDWHCFVKSLFFGFPNDKILGVQIEKRTPINEKVLYDVLLTKNGKWYSIDIGFLKSFRWSTLRKRFPKMVDPPVLYSVGAISSQDLVFFKNEVLPVRTEPVSL